MKANRLSKKHENEVIQFLDFAEKTLLAIMRFSIVLVKKIEVCKNIQIKVYIQLFRLW